MAALLTVPPGHCQLATGGAGRERRFSVVAAAPQAATPAATSSGPGPNPSRRQTCATLASVDDTWVTLLRLRRPPKTWPTIARASPRRVHGSRPERGDRPVYPLPGRGEELEGDVVGVAERQTRPVGGVDDAAVLDAEAVEALLPRLQLGPVGAPEGDVVEARPQLVHGVRGRGLAVL